MKRQILYFTFTCFLLIEKVVFAAVPQSSHPNCVQQAPVSIPCPPQKPSDCIDYSKPAPVDSKYCRKMHKDRGGELYQEYVTAIHTQRYRNEFTSAQWKTILLQKRVRVPFTAQDHRDMLEFFINE